VIKLVMSILWVGFLIASTSGLLQEPLSNYHQEAEMDALGNIYVSSDQGKLIWMADTRHCSQVSQASDRQTFVCIVMEDPERGNFVPSLHLEIYQRGGHQKLIEPGGPIREWHFSEDGHQVAVAFGPGGGGEMTHALYDLATAHLVEKVFETSDESLLPQWAKSALQVQDESVPMSADLSAKRTKWIAKVLRQIDKFRPGMRRKDLLTVFTTEGGLSTRAQRTYVYADCPYIKVTVRFRTSSNEGAAIEESPDDIIESISQPYLQWGIFD
jgi:hypothetical protein